jgi:hypothetical protein
LSSSSIASVCRSTTKAIFRPIQKTVKSSDTYSTSKVRPLSRCATVRIVGMAASGFVPASVLDSSSSSFDLQLDHGDREGPDCLVPSFREVFSAFTRDLWVYSLSYGVLCNKMYIHRLELM